MIYLTADLFPGHRILMLSRKLTEQRGNLKPQQHKLLLDTVFISLVSPDKEGKLITSLLFEESCSVFRLKPNFLFSEALTRGLVVRYVP